MCVVGGALRRPPAPSLGDAAEDDALTVSCEWESRPIGLSPKGRSSRRLSPIGLSPQSSLEWPRSPVDSAAADSASSEEGEQQREQPQQHEQEDHGPGEAHRPQQEQRPSGSKADARGRRGARDADDGGGGGGSDEEGRKRRWLPRGGCAAEDADEPRDDAAALAKLGGPDVSAGGGETSNTDDSAAMQERLSLVHRMDASIAARMLASGDLAGKVNSGSQTTPANGTTTTSGCGGDLRGGTVGRGASSSSDDGAGRSGARHRRGGGGARGGKANDAPDRSTGNDSARAGSNGSGGATKRQRCLQDPSDAIAVPTPPAHTCSPYVHYSGASLARTPATTAIIAGSGYDAYGMPPSASTTNSQALLSLLGTDPLPINAPAAEIAPASLAVLAPFSQAMRKMPLRDRLSTALQHVLPASLPASAPPLSVLAQWDAPVHALNQSTAAAAAAQSLIAGMLVENAFDSPE